MKTARYIIGILCLFVGISWALNEFPLSGILLLFLGIIILPVVLEELKKRFQVHRFLFSAFLPLALFTCTIFILTIEIKQKEAETADKISEANNLMELAIVNFKKGHLDSAMVLATKASDIYPDGDSTAITFLNDVGSY